jgi:hypothetical protein
MAMRVLAVFGFVAGLAALPWAAPAQAAPPAQPLARLGSCPVGYFASGAYCVPTASARFALPRDGSCPVGYYASGAYCVAASEHAALALPRRGACPAGYFASAQYCVQSR